MTRLTLDEGSRVDFDGWDFGEGAVNPIIQKRAEEAIQDSFENEPPEVDWSWGDDGEPVLVVFLPLQGMDLMTMQADLRSVLIDRFNYCTGRDDITREAKDIVAALHEMIDAVKTEGKRLTRTSPETAPQASNAEPHHEPSSG